MTQHYITNLIDAVYKNEFNKVKSALGMIKNEHVNEQDILN